MATLGERVKEARKAAGLSAAALARACGISRSAMSQIESGDTLKLKGETLLGIERATGYRGAWIATGKGLPQHKLLQSTEAIEDRSARIYQDIMRLPPEHRERIEREIDFLLSLPKKDK